ncbi:MAG TPA: hypothetical protein PLG26_01970, partial [Verrucomicrobiota bacterium]|nr:hypothetical protein [Verrucomicrobiota bacterium]HOU86854.1 hypothetical protein [Verrucomicrobiota bacterium]HPK97111.1 hypothetical protein [Verrucomicrobiota bacterium]HQA40988.1 hypothetical protein [Verrucomicrobiota bacterium]HQF58398.1 hypothetical protein [Verrucomicrobiota bacterium]
MMPPAQFTLKAPLRQPILLPIGVDSATKFLEYPKINVYVEIKLCVPKKYGSVAEFVGERGNIRGSR